MVELEQALERLLGSTSFSLRGKTVPLLDSVGKLCEQDLFSPMEQPPFSMARADGYAVRVEDIRGADESHPVTLRLLGTVYAGHPAEQAVGAGQAFRITEGAMIPEGANCIVNALYTDCSNEREVSVYTSAFYQQNIQQAGEEISKGQFVLRKWERIGAPQIGLLAGLGILNVPIYEPLKVGILTTGEEIVDPNCPLEKGKIYDMNQAMLRARVESLGMIPVVVNQAVGDDINKTCAAIEELLPRVDIVLTTGGVSLVKQDLIPQVYEELSVTPLFEGVNFWPGFQTFAGKIGRKIIFSLSGSPTACILSFELLVRPLCAKMSGERENGLKIITATFEGEMESNEPIEAPRFYFAEYDISKNAVRVLRKNVPPGGLLRAAESNCFVEIPKGVRSLQDGNIVRVILL